MMVNHKIPLDDKESKYYYQCDKRFCVALYDMNEKSQVKVFGTPRMSFSLFSSEDGV